MRTGDVYLVAAMESTFILGDPLLDSQIVFGRLRFRARGLHLGDVG